MGCVEDTLDLNITQGKTFTITFRWAAEPVVYRDISTIENTAPVRLTVPGHDMPDGWSFAVSGVEGMEKLNARRNPPADTEYHEATVVDPNTVEINKINGMLLDEYQGGGAIQYMTPTDISDMSARMEVRTRAGGDLLLQLHSDNGELVLDPANHTITLRIAPEVTEGIDWRRGVYDIEVFNETDVFLLAHGQVLVHNEVTVGG